MLDNITAHFARIDYNFRLVLSRKTVSSVKIYLLFSRQGLLPFLLGVPFLCSENIPQHKLKKCEKTK